MADRWTAWCARLVPTALRAAAFDPAAADLHAEVIVRLRAASGARRVAIRAAWAWAVFATALECRRLHVTALVTGGRRGAGRFGMGHDLRSAIRSLRHAPVLTLILTTVLALGIGANVAVFSFANTYLLVPLPVEQPDRLVRVYGRSATRAFDVVSYPDYRDARDAGAGLALAAHAESGVRLEHTGRRVTRTAELVSGNFFEVMKVGPVLGRLIVPEDDLVEGAHPVLVLGESLWRSTFGGDPRLIGATVRVNGAPFEVIGIAPEGFRGASSAYAVSDVWVPLAMHSRVRPRATTRETRDWGWLSMIGRLDDGVTIAAAAARLDELGTRLSRELPPSSAYTFDVRSASALPEVDRQRAVRALALAGGFTGLVLLAACANLAGLLYTRLHGRRRELAVRRALGASPARLIRILLFEALLLAAAASVIGLAGGRAAARLVERWKPPAQLVGDVSFQTALDWRVLVFVVVLTVLCAAVFGLLPALAAARASSASLLKEDAAGASGSDRTTRMRRLAIVIQVAVSVALLLAGGLLFRSAIALNRVDVGFDTANLGVFSVALRSPDGPIGNGRRLVAEALDRVRAVPGVARAAVANSLPLGVMKDRIRVRVPGYVPPDGASGVPVAFTRVSRTYFETMGIPLRRGDVWEGSFEAPGRPAVVINETMARQFWTDRDAVGSTIEIVGRGLVTVVGVARDSVYYALGEAPLPFMYLAAELAMPETMAMIVRTTTPVGGLLAQIEREIAAVDERLAPSASAVFDQLRSVPLYPARAFAAIAMTFGALALVLTAVGLYGVVAGTVAQRTREFGVRLALGAPSARLQRGVLREALGLAGAGGLLGLGGGYLGSAAFRAWLFGIGAFEPVTYAAVAGVVLTVTLAAAWAPARRAARIDPVTALRG
jgi:predicted permease